MVCCCLVLCIDVSIDFWGTWDFDVGVLWICNIILAFWFGFDWFGHCETLLLDFVVFVGLLYLLVGLIGFVFACRLVI